MDIEWDYRWHKETNHYEIYSNDGINSFFLSTDHNDLAIIQHLVYLLDRGEEFKRLAAELLNVS